MQVYKDAFVWDVMFVIEQLGCVLYNNASLKKYLTVSLEINVVSVPQPMETKIIIIKFLGHWQQANTAGGLVLAVHTSYEEVDNLL